MFYIARHMLLFCILLFLYIENSSNAAQKKVVIVGAGISGLTAGYELTKNGINFEIYEARDRVGGRLWTYHFDKKNNIFFDVGGTEIGAYHSNTVSIVNELGVKLRKILAYDKDLVIIDNKKLMSKRDIARSMKRAQSVLENIEDNLKNGKILASAPLAEYIKMDDKIAEKFIRVYYEQCMGNSFKNALAYNVFQILEEFRYLKFASTDSKKQDPDDQEYFYLVEGGSSVLIDALKNAITQKNSIYKSYILKEIRKGEDFLLYFDHYGNEEVVHADYVIITIPFSVLRHIKIDESVKLSALQKEAIEHLPYAINSKIGIELFGERNLRDQLFYYINLDDELIGWPGSWMLTLYVYGGKFAPLSEQIENKIGIKHAEIVAKLYPHKKIGRILAQNWSRDPFSLGSYSIVDFITDQKMFKESDLYEGLRAYADPVDGLIFGGEHMSSEHYGYIEGAVIWSGTKDRAWNGKILAAKQGRFLYFFHKFLALQPMIISSRLQEICGFHDQNTVE